MSLLDLLAGANSAPDLIEELRHYLKRMVEEQEKTNALLTQLVEKNP